MEKEVKAKGKTFQKMTRDGLVESTGDEEVKVSKRLSDADLSKGTYERVAEEVKPESNKSKQKRLRLEQDKKIKESVRNGNLKFAEDEQPVEEGRIFSGDKNPKKQKADAKKKATRKKSISLEESRKSKIQFGDEIEVPVDDPLVSRSNKSKMMRAISYGIHRKVDKESDDNASTEAAHGTERAAEGALRFGSSRIAKSQARTHERKHKLEEKSMKAGFEKHYEERISKDVSMQDAGSLKKFIQKQRIKREYTKAYRAEKYGTGAVKQGFGFVKETGKKTASFFAQNKGLVISLVALLLIFVLIIGNLSSCSAMFSQTMSYTMASSYIAEPEEIEKAEKYYTELEAALQQRINQLEAQYPGKDEYRYNIGAIEHDPHTLISYLTARYEAFTFAQVKDELDALFEAQYGVDVEETTDTIEETKTIQVGESLGNVVTSGYCNCSICCGQWSGGPTASGAMPTANHTLAVDASNPFVPMGTKVVMNGVEYTVEDTGNFARYGVQFDVYYDSHAAASNHGHKTWQCYLAEGNSNSVEVTRTVTIDVLNVTMTNKSLRSVIISRMDDNQKEMYDLIYSTKGNLQMYETPIELNWYGYISQYYGYAINNISGVREFHNGVEINVAEGTEVQSAMKGTVTSVGSDSNYGNYVVTQDKKGYQIKYAHLQNVTVSNGDAVEKDTGIGKSGSTGSVTGSQLYLELVKDGTYYNPIFYIESGEGGMYGNGGAAYDDETVQRLFEEAEKYLGMPYVWGGASPETSFDCSGFVSYVFTNSGVYNMGRLTAQGIYDICAPVDPSEAKAGDIIFFTGTYNAGVPVTHVGIYAGDGQMIHCGDPIQYTSINSPYWQSHFYGFGRPGR